MPRFEVTPDAVENAGASLERNGSQTSTVAATVDNLRGAGGGMSDPPTAAAYEELCAVWGIALEQLAGQVGSLGDRAMTAAAEYLSTDQAQMQGSGERE